MPVANPLPTLSQAEKDPFKITAVVRQISESLSRQPAIMLAGSAFGVDLNSGNTDTTIAINCPTTNYYVHTVVVKNKGTTASLTTATAGVFTSTGGGGIAVASNQALSGITANAVNTAAGLMLMSVNKPWLDKSTLYFRVGTAQGAAATADVYVYIAPLP